MSQLDDEVLSAAEAKTALAFIEARLFEPMSVKTIAASCGASPAHFSRAFTRRQGESVMAYVRGRRLEGAMRRLIEEPGVRLVDLAFDVGFDSQEAFTRAFVRAFGATPGSRSGATKPLTRKRRTRMPRPTIHCSTQDREAIQLAGLSAHFTIATTVEMPTLWGRLVSQLGFSGQLGSGETCGVWTRRHPTDGSFDFFAGVRVTQDCAPPEPLETKLLPARRYLVFRQMLSSGELHPQMLVATEMIWSELLPQSGCRLAAAPDFQIYPAPFKVEEGGWVDHYLPIDEMTAMRSSDAADFP